MKDCQTSSTTASRWFYGSGFDLVVGCGAWSGPLLLLAYLASLNHAQAVSITFYALALVLNYPHYMATIYRAFRTREDFAKYKLFTVHLTILTVIVLVLAHISSQLLAIVFTLYLTWSPYHYSGQNFGIALMFARRNGVQTSPRIRNTFYLTFLASYLMFFLAVHSFSSADQYILTLGIPAKVARVAWLASFAVFLSSAILSFRAFAKQIGWRKLGPPLVMLSTQVIWFIVPTALALFSQVELLQARSTAGILAVMHSAQYLWITSYYARREATENPAQGRSWRPYIYFSVLVVGGIALFIPGPWLASKLLHTDFTASFLAFTALVNIHHFLLDGAIWKLRDGRIAALLLNSTEHKGNFANGVSRITNWLISPRLPVRILRVGAAMLLVLVAGLDQLKFYYGTQANDITSLSRASDLNEFDAALQVRLARANETSGNQAGKRAALEAALRLNPSYKPAQLSLARMLIESGKYDEAYSHYQQMFLQSSPDVDSLINFGVLADHLGHADEAATAWRNAIERDPNQANPHLYLAQLLARQKMFRDAIPHYERYLALISEQSHDGSASSRTNPTAIVKVVLQLASACRNAGETEQALHFFTQGATLANRVGDQQGLAFALTQSGEIKSDLGRKDEALADFQRARALQQSADVVPATSLQQPSKK